VALAHAFDTTTRLLPCLQVKRLMALSLKQPVRLAADAACTAPKSLLQEVVRLKGAQAAQKEALLLALCCRSLRGGSAIVFFRTKQKAHRMKILFGLCGLPPAGELHGNMSQAARLESLEKFRRREVAFLLATDVAARGLDIMGVQVVVNFDCPRTLETYLHRIGRTARAGGVLGSHCCSCLLHYQVGESVPGCAVDLFAAYGGHARGHAMARPCGV
jgi:ATP-dependent RNA helicase DDX27